MGIFGQSTPFDAEIEKATSETNTNENWSLILDVCDKVSSNPRNAKECLKAIMKRMGHADPHVVMQAITLLDACANNCGKPFHLEVASREFENEFRRLLGKAQAKVSLKMRQVLKNWAENDFKNDPELNLIPSLYSKLRHEGHDFSNLNEKPAKSAAAAKAAAAAAKDPNVVSSQQEEDDIAKAIELSLKETKNSPKHQQSAAAGSGGAVAAAAGAGGATSASAAAAYPSLYPSFSGSGSLGSVSNTSGASQPEPRKVRALYDFEAAEENELTFFAGEIIHVLDDSDPNWWKGFNQRGDGLFPSNFVTADLSVDPERLDINQQNKSTKKTVQFEDDARELQQKTEAAVAAAANQRVEIDEAKVDRLLHLLHEANPEDPSQDSDEMLRLEQEVHQMGPLIDAELERVDRKHAQLTQLSSDLVDAINLYHSLMRDDRAALMGASGFPGASGMPPGMSGYPGGGPNAHMLYGTAGYAGVAGGSSFPPSQHMPMPQNSYGMGSLPYAGNAGQMPDAGVGNGASLAGSMVFSSNAPLQMAAGPQSMPIPMQFQNGHVNSPQLNGGLNALPQHMSSAMAPGQAQQQQPQQQSYQMLPPQQQQAYLQQPHTTATTASMPPLNATTATIANNPQQQQQQSTAPPQFQQHQQIYMQHPQQQQQQFTPISNGPQASYMPPSSNNNNNAQPPDQQQQQQFNQLQQQMAAISMQHHHQQQQQQLQHAAINQNQPVTQNFLVQNEPKNNIPIYQQQR